MKKLKNSLTSKVILLLVSFIFSSVDLAASPKTAGKTDALERHVAKSISRAQHSTQKKGKLRKPDVIYYPTPLGLLSVQMRRRNDIFLDVTAVNPFPM
jgi:hypothetical protein